MSPLRLTGSTSGYSQIDAPAVAGDQTFTLPGTGGTLDRLNRAGNILQVVQSTKTDTASFTSTTYASSGLSVTITPSSSSNKILCMAQVNMSWDNAAAKGAMSLFRDSTKIHFGDARGSRSRDSNAFYLGIDSYTPIAFPIVFMDSPSTTSAVVYTVQIRNMDGVGTVYINRSTDADTDNSIYATTASSLICMEVAA